jgi:hypothetical protein
MRAALNVARNGLTGAAILTSSNAGNRSVRRNRGRTYARGSIDRTKPHRPIALNTPTRIVPAGRLLNSVSFADGKTWALIGPVGWIVFVLGVFLAKPLWLLKWDEALKDQVPPKTKLHDTELSLGISHSCVLLIRPLAYRYRVLDAWVRAHVYECLKNFEKVRDALNLSKLSSKLPRNPNVVDIRVENYVDADGEDALRVTIVIDEDVDVENVPSVATMNGGGVSRVNRFGVLGPGEGPVLA